MWQYIVKFNNAAWGVVYFESMPLFADALQAEREARRACRTMKVPEPRYVNRAEPERGHVIVREVQA